RNGGNGDEASPVVALHVGDDFPGQIDEAEEVHVDGTAPLFHGGGQEILGRRAAGIGYANVDAAELFYDFGNEALHRVKVGDVRGLCQDLNTGSLLNLTSGGLKGFLIASTDREGGTLGGEGFGGGASHALAGAGNDDYATFESEFHAGG